MSLITKALRQRAVYWPLGSAETGGFDTDDYGQPAYAAAYELACRWEDVSEEFLDGKGERSFSNSHVMVGNDVMVGGVLWLGNLVDVTDLLVPKNNAGAWEIKRFDKSGLA